MGKAVAAQGKLRQKMALADSKIKPWQRVIHPGHYIFYWHNREQQLAQVISRERGENICYCFCISRTCLKGEYRNIHISMAEGFVSEEVFNLIYESVNAEED